MISGITDYGALDSDSGSSSESDDQWDFRRDSLIEMAKKAALHRKKKGLPFEPFRDKADLTRTDEMAMDRVERHNRYVFVVDVVSCDIYMICGLASGFLVVY